MAITNGDVKLFESQRLNDEEDGGGRVTVREVIDGRLKPQPILKQVRVNDQPDLKLSVKGMFYGIRTGGPGEPYLLSLASGIESSKNSTIGLRRGSGSSYSKLWCKILTLNGYS